MRGLELLLDGQPSSCQRGRGGGDRRGLARGGHLGGRLQLGRRHRGALVQATRQGVVDAREHCRGAPGPIRHGGARGERREDSERQHRGDLPRCAVVLSHRRPTRRAAAQVRTKLEELAGRGLPVGHRGEQRRPPLALRAGLDPRVAGEEPLAPLGYAPVHLPLPTTLDPAQFGSHRSVHLFRTRIPQPRRGRRGPCSGATTTSSRAPLLLSGRGGVPEDVGIQPEPGGQETRTEMGSDDAATRTPRGRQAASPTGHRVTDRLGPRRVHAKRALEGRSGTTRREALSRASQPSSPAPADEGRVCRTLYGRGGDHRSSCEPRCPLAEGSPGQDGE